MKLKTIYYLVACFILATMLFTCTSCSQKVLPPVVADHVSQTDKVKEKIVRDSIYVHDSIYIHEKGDTVFVDRWHNKYVDRFLHDTVYNSVMDSVPVTVYVDKPVPYVPGIYKWSTGGFWIIVLLVVLWVVWKVAKAVYLRR